MKSRSAALSKFLLMLSVSLTLVSVSGQDEDGVETITGDECATCHEESAHGTAFAEDLEHSSHQGFDCLLCHIDKETVL